MKYQDLYDLVMTIWESPFHSDVRFGCDCGCGGSSYTYEQWEWEEEQYDHAVEKLKQMGITFDD